MSPMSSARNWLDRPVGRVVFALFALALCFVPAWMFADPLSTYRLHSDDFAYVAGSRNFGKTLSNLFVPHNTHIVPAWRLVTWGIVAWSSKLANLPDALSKAAYAMLVATMLLVGRLTARETGRSAAGLAALVAVGTTWLMKSAGTWYSAGQTLWAAFGVMATLWYLQGWRRSPKTWRLAMAALCAWGAGACWTVGHIAGPVGAVYLWADGRRRCRRAAVVPLLATAFAIVIALALGGKKINATISFHGRTSRQAISFTNGAMHTLQAIPEDLVFGNLGLTPETTVAQGAVLSGAILLTWLASWRRRTRPTPFEWAGATLAVGSYLIEWSFRGYLPFSSLRGIVPWYDTLPHVGAVLFVAGWWSRSRTPPARESGKLIRCQLIAIAAFQAALVIIHQPRVTDLFIHSVPAMSADEVREFPITSLQRMRAFFLANEHARWQIRHLSKLDQAEARARSLGIGRAAIGKTFGRVLAPEIPDVYDAAEMLDLPWEGSETDPELIRRALGPLFAMEPEPPSDILPGLRAMGFRSRFRPPVNER